MGKPSKIIAVAVIGLLQCALALPLKAEAQNSTGIYTVNVSTPGTFGQILLQSVENWTDVVELTVTGHLNATDMAYFFRMQNLKKLDVRNTDITSMVGCKGLTSLETVALPASVKTIDDEAFSGCSSLSSIELNGIESIGASAFSGCSSLNGSIIGPWVKTIGTSAFFNCNNIESISFPVIEEIWDSAFESNHYNKSKLSSVKISTVKYIGKRAFRSCSSVTTINIPNCEEIGSSRYQDDGCFYECSNLKNVALSDKLTEIPSGCFYKTGIEKIVLPKNLLSIGERAFDGAKLTDIEIPEGTKTVGFYAFSNCPLVSITLPSSLESISDYAFSTDVLKTVYCKRIVPLNTYPFGNSMVNGANLYVPAFSVSAYKLDDNWYKFNKIIAIDGELTDITIDNTFTIVDYTGLGNNANLNLSYSQPQNTSAHLSISANSPLSLGTFRQNQNYKYKTESYRDPDGHFRDHYLYPYCTTLITNNEVRANNVSTKVLLPTNRWSFISFPYDVNVSSIIVPEGAMWVVRKYNGANRAAMKGDTWENVTSGQILNAGEGYIFHCVTETGDSWEQGYAEFEFPAINNSKKNNIFSFTDVAKTINQYPAEFSHNRGWNLIGNPYPSYLSSKYVEFSAPITVWNGDGYTAYSLVDDEYVLRPNEAFFVQCPVNTNEIIFSKDGRTHLYDYSSEYYRSCAVAQSSDKRAILNFVISDDNYSDRTRLVLNESAAYDYEIERDASKFMSSNESVPQIHLVDNGINYAIDERPLGTGEFALSVKIGKQGNYKISLNAKNSEYDVLLTDNESDATTNLASDSYSFESAAKVYNNRFTIKVNAKDNQASIDDILTDNAGFHVNGNMLSVEHNARVSLYSIDGKTVHNGVIDGSLELPSGTYLLSINNTTHKVVIK